VVDTSPSISRLHKSGLSHAANEHAFRSQWDAGSGARGREGLVIHVYTVDDVVKLTLAVAMINAWNRITIGLRSVHPVKVA